MNESELSKNTLSFIALAHEYCTALEQAPTYEVSTFVETMLKLLPRLYITATDLCADINNEAYIEPYLEEEYYDSIRNNIAALLGENDTYLEVFEEDMKYSDTPIGASVSESLSDIFQELYNFMSNIKDAPGETINEYAAACRENFEAYWGQTLCNVMRPLNAIKYNKD